MQTGHDTPSRVRRHASGRLAAASLIATGIGHAAVGVVLFRDPLLAMLADGVVNAIPATLPPLFDREAAFWFLLFGPALVMLGEITRRAAASGDGAVIRTIGRHLLGLGVIGVIVMPVSGFWILIGLAPLLFRTAADVEAQPSVVAV